MLLKQTQKTKLKQFFFQKYKNCLRIVVVKKRLVFLNIFYSCAKPLISRQVAVGLVQGKKEEIKTVQIE